MRAAPVKRNPLGRKMKRTIKIAISGIGFTLATLCAVFCGLLIPVYRSMFDMEMSRAEMMRHVRNAEIALALFSLVAAVALWQLVRTIRSRPGERSN